ncbi:MAG: type II toxin-antitoxin system RelE/ParE family toxin [Zoogloea sp.]|nr:type II toxin-antitoxin system RelE/ParE family toxin [Zoogloea sp.]
MRHVFHPAATQEFIDALGWYLEEAGAVQAMRFAKEVHRGLRLVARMPALGSPGKNGVRRFPLPHFPYLLVYPGEPGLLRVIAVAHLRREPDYWSGRRQAPPKSPS